MPETLDLRTLAELTTKIVATDLAHHTVATAEISVLIAAVRGTRPPSMPERRYGQTTFALHLP